jgi:hypothetical protein
MAEYRKKLLRHAEETVVVPSPQQWRLSVAKVAEELVTGTSFWPECVATDADVGLPAWWSPNDGNTRPDSLGVNLEAFGNQDSERRGCVRHRKACAVCARMHWHAELREVRFWPEQGEVKGDCLFGVAQSARGRRPSRVSDSADDEDVTARTRDAYEGYQELFSPQRYHERWRFVDKQLLPGGIPLAELEASCVCAPDGSRWLLHRKMFRIDAVTGRLDPLATAPICKECYGTLRESVPRLPKFSLANDLWLGCMPAPLARLSEGALMLLAVARAFIRRYVCKPDSGIVNKASMQIKGYVGNVCVFPQSDGGRVLMQLPPTEQDMVESLLLAFVGPEEDMQYAYIKQFGVDLQSYKLAYEFLKEHNFVYRYVDWDDAATELFLQDRSRLGLPKIFANCVRVAADEKVGTSVRQEGPAEAVESDGESDASAGEEEWEVEENAECPGSLSEAKSGKAESDEFSLALMMKT